VRSAEAYDVACVVHLHSLYSDGTGTVPEIARAARASDVDVVLLTDHDSLEAKHRGEEGDYDGVLVLVGEEVSPRGGNHYLAFGIEEEVEWRGLSTAEMCQAVREAGGFGFAAHPFSRGSERFRRATGMPFDDLDAADGIELWSWVTDTVERLPSVPAAARFVALPHRVVAHPPPDHLAAWNDMCAKRRVPAIGGIDAHQFGKRIAGRVPLRLMSYKRSFRHMRTHVLCESPEPSRDGVFAALREGRAYMAIDSLAPARGFRFWAEGPGGEVAMGEEAPTATHDLHVTIPRPAKLRLLRDGEELTSAETPALAHRVSEPGVYRVEARLDAYGSERTWIVSNPIYLR
jgi:hypothetical protein